MSSRPWMLILSLFLFMALAGCGGMPASDDSCPQPRFTGKAPEEYYALVNPLAADEGNIAAGRRLYRQDAAKVSCVRCHGARGDGNGALSTLFEPPPRNFTCAETINGVPDGQLFWIIKHGSPGTSMPAFDTLGDRNIWQLVLYVRELANGSH